MDTETRQYTITAEKEFLDRIEEIFDQFKPVEEKKPEWEILAFSRDECTDLLTLGNKNRYNMRHLMYRPTMEEALREPGFNIYRVKRLSDGEVFAIGDYTDIGYIRSFEIRYNGEQMWLKCDCDNGTDIKYATKKCALKSSPIFITEEGKELFNKEDMVYSVCPKSTWETREFTAGQMKTSIENYGGWKAWKHFSSSELREQYILENKPVLSYKDIHEIDHAGNGKYLAITEVRLKNLVKSKL
jgi:hypothetical protein